LTKPGGDSIAAMRGRFSPSHPSQKESDMDKKSWMLLGLSLCMAAPAFAQRGATTGFIG
jgi:hypothetical protein